MKLSASIAACLDRIKIGLRSDDHELIALAMDRVSLDELLSQETIENVRARREHVVSIFLCSLAVANRRSFTRAGFWLACYQSILSKNLDAGLERLSKNNIVKMVVRCLAHKEPLNGALAAQATGSDQEWQDSLELCLDFNDWSSAVALLEARARVQQGLFWRRIAKSLAGRQRIYRTAKIYADEARLAHLYEICIKRSRGPDQLELAPILAPLQIDTLERAGRFNDAIRILEKKPLSTRTPYDGYVLSRLICKAGDLRSSITQLDNTLKLILDQGSPIGAPLEETEGGSISLNHDHGASFLSRSAAALRDLAVLLNEMQQKVFLVSGTLLGYVREGALLSHDKDVDVGVIGWEQQFDLFRLLWNSPLFSISPRHLSGERTHLLPVNHVPTGVAIDIFLYRRENERLVTGVEYTFGHRQRFAFTPFELEAIKFLGVDLYKPANSELNLLENFGNWRVPDPGYISHLESPSAIDAGGLDFMVTARLHAVTAMQAGKTKKLRRVLKIMERYNGNAGAMDPALRAQLEAYCDQFEASLQGNSFPIRQSPVEVVNA